MGDDGNRDKKREHSMLTMSRERSDELRHTLSLVSNQPISHRSLSNTARESTSAIPIASFSMRSYTTNVHRRQLQTSERSRTDNEGADRHTHAIGTRVIPRQRIKNLTQLWRGGAARCGVVRWHGAAKCEIHHGPPSAGTSFFSLSFSPPPFFTLTPFRFGLG